MFRFKKKIKLGTTYNFTIIHIILKHDYILVFFTILLELKYFYPSIETRKITTFLKR